MLLNCSVGEDSWESFGLQRDQSSQFQRKLTLNIYWKDWCWTWSSNTLATWCKELIRKDPDAGQDWRQEEKGMTEDEMLGWHHWLNGYEFEQALGDGEGQISLACYSSWGHKESDMTEWLNNNKGRRGRGDGSGMIQVHYTYYALYFYYYCISSTSGHWALDLGGSQCYRMGQTSLYAMDFLSVHFCL